jgi:uncharacterized protein YabE (DUF348 family)
MFARRIAAHRKPASRRPALLAVGTTSLAAAVIAGGSLVNASAAEVPTVTLEVDGDVTQVTTTAPTVGDLLVAEDVSTDGNDVVSPGPSAALGNSMTVAVDHRAEVTVQLPDSQSSTLVTADTVGQLKQELGLPTADQSSMRLSATQPSTWKRTLVQRPNGKTIIGKDPVVEGTVATVQNVRVSFVKQHRRLHHSVVQRRTPLLHAGTVKVLRQGRDGRATLTVRRKFVDSKFVHRRIVQRKVQTPKRNRVVLTGTGPNWTALANCESGNNPRAVNPAGYYGLYQFSLSTWAAVGGYGNPINASRMEQTKRAWILYQRSGRSPWPVCGANL